MISFALTSFFVLVTAVVSIPLPNGIQVEGKLPDADAIVFKAEESSRSNRDGSTRMTRSSSDNNVQTEENMLKLYPELNYKGNERTFRSIDCSSTSSIRNASSAKAFGHGACYELYTSPTKCEKRLESLIVRTGDPISRFNETFNDKVTHVRQC